MAIEVIRRLRQLAADEPEPEAFLVRVNPDVAAELVAEGSGLFELEAETGEALPLRGRRGARDRHLRGRRPGHAATEIEERALPFRVGEEVLVTIEEPHMYNADDAIARVDSYIVSVSGGGRHIGERRLVRIESVARSAATAVAARRERRPVEAVGEKLESALLGRRRGRRGGRRRSRARSGSGSATSG